jgi:hypothetical protein
MRRNPPPDYCNGFVAIRHLFFHLHESRFDEGRSLHAKADLFEQYDDLIERFHRTGGERDVRWRGCFRWLIHASRILSISR